MEGIRERITPKSVTSQSNPLIPTDMRTLEFTLSICYDLRGLKPHLMVDKDETSQFGGWGSMSQLKLICHCNYTYIARSKDKLKLTVSTYCTVLYSMGTWIERSYSKFR